MKDLLTCSLDELLTERQIAIEKGNIERYRECNELISAMYNDLNAEDYWDGDETDKIQY